MIQLIGFLMSVYMFVRGLDIMSCAEDRKPGWPEAEAHIAAWIAIVGGIIFFILFVVQGNAAPSLPSTDSF